MKRVLLLRHGRTEANDRGLYCGSTDLPLSPRGRAQLEEKRAAARQMDLTGIRVYISPLRRARETLEILWGLEGTVEPDLREMDFGAFEMKSYQQLQSDERFQIWCTGDNEKNICPGGESGEKMTARVLSAFRRLTAMEGDCLLVFHGGPIAAVMAQLFPAEGKSRYHWQPENGSGYEILMDGERALCYHTILE